MKAFFNIRVNGIVNENDFVFKYLRKASIEWRDFAGVFSG